MTKKVDFSHWSSSNISQPQTIQGQRAHGVTFNPQTGNGSANITKNMSDQNIGSSYQYGSYNRDYQLGIHSSTNRMKTDLSFSSNSFDETSLFDVGTTKPSMPSVYDMDSALLSHFYDWNRKLFIESDCGYDEVEDPLSEPGQNKLFRYIDLIVHTIEVTSHELTLCYNKEKIV
jgi:hypothetical protein